jgi:AraC-like DNA-binding protein
MLELYRCEREDLLAKIAVELERALQHRTLTGGPGRAVERKIAQGDGWAVSDVICTCAAHDRPFEERHKGFSIVLVTAGSFQYQASLGRSRNRPGAGRELMSPGSLLLGNPGQSYECGHDHGAGDRCISFWYAPEYFERLAADAGAKGTLRFGAIRVPALREFSPLAARACAGVSKQTPGEEDADVPWAELSLRLAGVTLQLLGKRGSSHAQNPPSSTLARVTRAVRMIEQGWDAELNLDALAKAAGLSPYHFLRTFEQLTGLTPHQYVRRVRLRQAAARLASEPAKVLDIALDCGFGDVSNFNRAFRGEFGVNPARFRDQARAKLTTTGLTGRGLRRRRGNVLRAGVTFTSQILRAPEGATTG